VWFAVPLWVQSRAGGFVIFSNRRWYGILNQAPALRGRRAGVRRVRWILRHGQGLTSSGWRRHSLASCADRAVLPGVDDAFDACCRTSRAYCNSVGFVADPRSGTAIGQTGWAGPERRPIARLMESHDDPNSGSVIPEPLHSHTPRLTDQLSVGVAHGPLIIGDLDPVPGLTQHVGSRPHSHS
jgi:hypothetical protein